MGIFVIQALSHYLPWLVIRNGVEKGVRRPTPVLGRGAAALQRAHLEPSSPACPQETQKQVNCSLGDDAWWRCHLWSGADDSCMMPGQSYVNTLPSRKGQWQAHGGEPAGQHTQRA